MLSFYKAFNKNHFRELEEEINYLSELYFNSAYGPSQLKTQFTVDWETQEVDIELQEYFFNIRSDLLSVAAVTQQVDWVCKKGIPEDYKLELKTIIHQFEIAFKIGSEEERKNHARQAATAQFSPITQTPVAFDTLDTKDVGLSLLRKLAPIVKTAFTINNFLKKFGMKVKEKSKEGNGNEESSDEEEEQLAEGNSKDGEEEAVQGPKIRVKKFDITEHKLPDVNKMRETLENLKALLTRCDADEKETAKKNKTDQDHSLYHYLQVKTGYMIKRAADIIIQLDSYTERESRNEDFERFKQITGDLLFDSRVYLAMFSRKDIYSLIKAMPETAIKELVKVDSVVNLYTTCFRDLVKVFYQWMIETTDKINSTDPEAQAAFYVHSSTLMMFFNKLIAKNRITQESCFQKELIYFDFLFTIYQRSGASSLLRSYSTAKIGLGDSANEFRSAVEQLIGSNFTDSVLDRTVQARVLDPQFEFLLRLLLSMGFASSRFFVTDTSSLLKKRMTSFIGDLTSFIQPGTQKTSNEQGGPFPTLQLGFFESLIPGEESEEESRRINIQRVSNAGFVRDLAETESSSKFGSDYFYSLYPLVVRLQSNIMFKADEGLLDGGYGQPFAKTSVAWQFDQSQLAELCKKNLMLLNSEKMIPKIKTEKDYPLFKACFREVLFQTAVIIYKVNMASADQSDDDDQSESNAANYNRSQHQNEVEGVFKNIFGQREKEVKIDLKTKLAQILETLLKISKHLGISEKVLEQQIIKLHVCEGINKVLDHIITVIENSQTEESPKQKGSNKVTLETYMKDYGRESVHRSLPCMKIFEGSTKYTSKYNSQSRPDECYYRGILMGEVEMEVDSKELRMGLARSFVRLFNKMMLTQKIGKRFPKIAADVSRQGRTMFRSLYKRGEFTKFKREEWIKSRQHDGESYEEQHEVLKFIHSMQTSYFYNEVYARSIILYEKLIDEIPDLKKFIYMESLRNRIFVNSFRGKDIAKYPGELFPYLQNFHSLSLRLGFSISSSLFLNKNSSILMSNLFILISLLNNLNQDNFVEFKILYIKDRFDDPYIDMYKEAIIQNPKHQESHDSSEVNSGRPVQSPPPLDLAAVFRQANEEAKQELRSSKLEITKQEAKKSDTQETDDNLIFIDPPDFEENSRHVLMSLSCRIHRLLEHFNLDERINLAGAFEDQRFLTVLPLLSMWLKLLQGCMYIPLQTDPPELAKESGRLVCYYYKKIMYNYLLKCLFEHEEIHQVEALYFKMVISSLTFKMSTMHTILEHILKYHSDFRSIFNYTIKVSKIYMSSLLLTKQTLKKLKFWQKGQTEIKTNENDHVFDHKNQELVRLNAEVFGGCIFERVMSEAEFKKEDNDLSAEASNDELRDCYNGSDNRDLGFQFINSLVKIMNYIETTTVSSFKLWSTKKESARVQFDVEPSSLSTNKLYELKMVYFISSFNKQIEVVDWRGRSVLITFRKYPEICTLDSLNPLDRLSEFKFEDFKRDVSRIIPELYFTTNIQYTIMRKMGRMYTFLKSDTSKKYPVILWWLSVILNLVIVAGNVNPLYRDDTHTYRNDSFFIAEKFIAFIILSISGAVLLSILITRSIVIKQSLGSLRGSSISTAKKKDLFTQALGKFTGFLRFLFENQYYIFFKNMVLEPTAFQVLLHIVFILVGTFIHKISFSFSLMMFIFFSKTTRHVLRSITTNLEEIIIALIIVLIMTYIYTILQFFYYFDNFSDYFGNSKPCSTLINCYMNVINYGIRYGGGLGENTKYVPEYISYYEYALIYNLTFFFFINIIGLNIVFGIIIDTFSELREIENKKESILKSTCLVCGMKKTQFESLGIDFRYHLNLQHNIEDYVAYLIRLFINKSKLDHDIDYYIFNNLKNLNVSWLPNQYTIFIEDLLKAVDETDERRELREDKVIHEKVCALDKEIQQIHQVLNQIYEKLNPSSMKDSPQLDHREFHLKMPVHSESVDRLHARGDRQVPEPDF
jgi:hypothetical protein